MAAAYLEVKDSQGVRRVELEDGPLTVGRNFTNLLVLEDIHAGRFHCVFEKGPQGYQVRDLDTRSGTRVNGTPVRQANLSNGDVVSIGKTELKLVIAAAAPSGPADASELMDQMAELVSTQETPEPPAAAAAAAVPEAPPRRAVLGANEYERHLRERAEALPDRSFTESQITLINARGKIAHAGDHKANISDALLNLRLIMLICFRSRATDIHVEPKADDVHVRIRVDGGMIDLVRLSKELGVRLLSLVKVLGDIDIAQRNIVQEGHFSARVPDRRSSLGASERRVDYRLSFAPTMHGQKLVIRILDAANAPLYIDDLQLPAKARQIIQQASNQESGMLLVSGPTGSGKTTTLYAILRGIDVSQYNVVTIEDPVEIQLEGVTQIPVNDAQGNTFSALLRSVLRQDPDVILVGEMRDAETARVGVQAGMTGHLVFSTVHSRDAMSGMFRLLDLGVEPYVVASALQLVIAQRLVRQLCASCKTAVAPTPEQIKRMADAGIRDVPKLFIPKGCRRCLGTGHLGRHAIFELVVVTPALRETILKNPSVQECRKTLDPANYITLAESGYRLIADGLADFDEVEKAIA
jgi:type II secretory ATPase GspE/PulE/Tfp pilus assembly ATPase PilB-like protein